ncbi:TraC family protein [Pukyongiella litopenaei]|uniref:TraC family protein n=1 Tax=Pukyongiella litopenaei TaxID=2605946 RepID=A0A5C2H654_9RHOB|nr:TraC family protein [Pukyongiella litopenaei]QEP30432.1 TraC family protein [Pukyongiella litopenaei]
MSFLRDMLAGFLGEEPLTDTATDLMAGEVLSDILPWRFHDAERGLYYFEHGTGFLIEVGAAIGANDLAENIGGVIAANLPSDATVQVLNWASPGIEAVTGRWQSVREGRSPLVDEMVRQRVAHLAGMRFGSGDTGARSIPFDRHIFIAGWLEGTDLGLEDEKRLGSLRSGLRNVFSTVSWARDVEPVQFLALLRELLHIARPEGSKGEWGAEAYDEAMPLNYQLPGATLRVGSNALRFSGSPGLSATVASVNAYPPEWVFGLGMALNGDPARLMDRAVGPVLTSFTLKPMNAQKAGSFILARRGKNEHAANTSFGRFVPQFAEKKQEFDDLAAELGAGERLFQTLYTVVSYACGGSGDAEAAAGEMESIYRRQRVKLSKDTYLQLPLFLASLPFGCTNGMMTDFGRQMRMRLLKGAAAMAFLPVHGEWMGNSRGTGMLLLGRQGQVFQWDNFVSSGNYNTAVVGKSGAGKSVFMQELACGIYSAGGHVLVIDDGYSFRTTAEILGGKHIAFDGGTVNRLNPFSLLDKAAMVQDEYRADAIELVTRVVASMADLGSNKAGRVEGVEEDYIRSAIAKIWDEKGPGGEISDVRDELDRAAANEPRLPDVVRKLNAYSRGGVYGGYFEGEANIALDAPFTVVELSDIKGQPGLEATILQIMMFLGTELMFRTPRDTPVAIVIDEAWDLLRGDGTASFIEGVVRRARKYTGALITGTQSMSDYAANPAANVCLENSDYRIFLAQKPESIDALQSVTPGVKGLLKSLTSVPGRFAELAIQMPEGFAYGRLLLDPFSLAIFSSKGATVQRMNQYRASGMSTVEAIRTLVERGEVS